MASCYHIGYYPDSEKVCQNCHESCYSCVAENSFNCTSCDLNHTNRSYFYFQPTFNNSDSAENGECIPHCLGSYSPDPHQPPGNICRKCHYQCVECARPYNKSYCTVCNILMQSYRYL